VVGDTVAPNYFATTLETISADDQLGLIDPRIHLTAVKPDERDGPDLNAIFVKVRLAPPVHEYPVGMRVWRLHVWDGFWRASAGALRPGSTSLTALPATALPAAADGACFIGFSLVVCSWGRRRCTDRRAWTWSSALSPG
jgi:hypothetical protein